MSEPGSLMLMLLDLHQSEAILSFIGYIFKTTTSPDVLKEIYQRRAWVFNVQFALPFFNLHQQVVIMNCFIL